jgi:transcriptional regulator with XRE-family HTH domain
VRIIVHDQCTHANVPAVGTRDLPLVTLIGSRVRARRHDRGWTLDELAERSGVSRRMLVNVEHGAANASIATLLRLADALGIGLPALVAPNPDGSRLEIVRAGERAPLWRGDHGGEAVLAAGITTPEVVELWDWTLGPGDSHASEPHRTGTRELLALAEGEIVVTVAGEEAVLRAGDTLVLPGDTVHGYRNDAAVTARFALAVFEPAVPEARR